MKVISFKPLTHFFPLAISYSIPSFLTSSFYAASHLEQWWNMLAMLHTMLFQHFLSITKSNIIVVAAQVKSNILSSSTTNENLQSSMTQPNISSSVYVDIIKNGSFLLTKSVRILPLTTDLEYCAFRTCVLCQFICQLQVY